MSYAGAIMGIVGGILTAYGQYAEGKAAQKVARYNARVALQNAEAARQAAEFEARQAENEAFLAREAASVREENVRRAGERATAEARQIAAAAGVRPDEGSALLVQMQNVRETEIAALRERYSGERLAEAAETEARKIRYIGQLRERGFRQEARLQKYGIRVSRTLETTKMLGTILTSASGMGGMMGGGGGGGGAGTSGGFSTSSVGAQSWGYM